MQIQIKCGRLLYLLEQLDILDEEAEHILKLCKAFGQDSSLTLDTKSYIISQLIDKNDLLEG